MHRFFVPPDWLVGGRAQLGGEVARQIARVLRLVPGDEITVLDNTGWEHRVRLVSVSAAAVQGEVLGRKLCAGEPRVRVTLYQGVLKGEKFEWVLQKGTELGVSSFVPVFCGRSVPRFSPDWSEGKYARWRRVLTEAAEQARRGRIPDLALPLAFSEACARAQGLSLIPWEEERVAGLRTVLRERLREGAGTGQAPPSVNLFIGPEGGFSPEEVALARTYGIISVTLGVRVLRAETAGLAVAAAVLYEAGELGPGES
ncbi:MAG: 16S rRNA (uracil(1498)-N(3))-methyltransferase [Chloroflexi bacterium]|nr:16S rRNA (uracil(1498)-N(3))-methyltransferase [Chloroflexota bacterium]